MNLIIDLSQTRDLYPIFYQVAFAVGLTIFIYEGIRQKYPLSTWLIISASASFFLIFGSKILAYDFESLTSFLKHGHLHEVSGKSAFGAAIIGLVGIYLVKRLLNFKSPILPAFAFFLPSVMLLQRIGCLCAGCCFGNETSLLWGIQYQGLSFLRDYQINEWIIDSSQFVTKPVHPVPLYFIAIAVLTITILLIARKRIISTYKMVYLSFICLAVGRFMIEFFRNPITNHSLGKIYMGLNVVQWSSIPFIFIALYLLFSKTNSKPLKNFEEPLRIGRNIIIIFALTFLIFLLRKWFGQEELAVLHLQIVVSSVSLFVYILKFNRISKQKLAYLAMFPLSLLLMSQTYPAKDSLDNKTKIALKTNLTVNNLGEPRYPASRLEQGCLGDNIIADRDYQKPMGPGYSSYKIGLDLISPFTKKSDFLLGSELELERYSNTSLNYITKNGNLHIHIGFDGKRYFGIHGGAKIGNIFRDAVTVGGNEEVLPTMQLWFGYKPVMAIHLKLNESNLFGSGPAGIEGSVNFNLSNRESQPNILTFGFGELYFEDQYFYTGLDLYIFNRFRITPNIGVLKSNKLNASMGVKLNF